LLLAPRVRPTCISAPTIKHQHNESHVGKLLKKSACILRRHDPRCVATTQICVNPQKQREKEKKKEKRKRKKRQKNTRYAPMIHSLRSKSLSLVVDV
jgi:hypothetical protein